MMELFVKSYDGEKVCFTTLVLEDIDSLTFSINPEKFCANFLYPNSPVYLGCCEELIHIDNQKHQNAIYNPTTKHVKFLPGTTIDAVQKSGSECSTDFNCTGFGKDLSTGEFKVIRNVVTNYETDGLFDGCSERFELYSSGTDSWKEIEAPDDAMLSPVGSIYIGGLYYWPSHLPDGSWGIRSFDFATESFSTISLPPYTLDFTYFLVNLNLGYGKDHQSLGCILFQRQGSEKRFELWSWQTRTTMSWVCLREFLVPNVDRPVGFVSGRLLFLEERIRINEDLYRLKVYDCLFQNLKNLEIFDQNGYMQVVSWVKSGAELPKAKPLSECNDASFWEDHWQRTLPLTDYDWSNGDDGDGDGDGDGD